jgi:hypothetical protein
MKKSTNKWCERWERRDVSTANGPTQEQQLFDNSAVPAARSLCCTSPRCSAPCAPHQIVPPRHHYLPGQRCATCTAITITINKRAQPGKVKPPRRTCQQGPPSVSKARQGKALLMAHLTDCMGRPGRCCQCSSPPALQSPPRLSGHQREKSPCRQQQQQ